MVVCRTSEFEHLTRLGRDNGLHGATTLTLQPLPVTRIGDHLTTYQHDIGADHPAWTDLIAHIRDHPQGPVATALQTPWLLGLTATALHHAPDVAVRLLDCPDPEAVRELLCAAQIPAAVAATDDSGDYRDYTVDNVETWLRSLAHCLQHRHRTGRDGTGIRLGEIWEIAGQTRTGVLHGLTVGLLAGLSSGILLTCTFDSALGIRFGLANGGVAAATAVLVQPSAIRFVWTKPSHFPWREGLVYGSLAWLVVGVVSGLDVAPEVGFMRGLELWLTFAPMTGLMFMLMFGGATGRFYAAALIFRFANKFPMRPADFLDRARRSGLLRVNGTAYQFRHQTYQQWIQQAPSLPDRTVSPMDVA
ncbi:hypothetical protein [Nocardia paucivorans]|uniref:hypothetical protein n=1 Tax=Nocardia paucivorans TaxID=114259 RepID=UPI000592FA44|nr:hypothetical protein [Nocardia paucivorans]